MFERKRSVVRSAQKIRQKKKTKRSIGFHRFFGKTTRKLRARHFSSSPAQCYAYRLVRSRCRRPPRAMLAQSVVLRCLLFPPVCKPIILLFLLDLCCSSSGRSHYLGYNLCCSFGPLSSSSQCHPGFHRCVATTRRRCRSRSSQKRTLLLRSMRSLRPSSA